MATTTLSAAPEDVVAAEPPKSKKKLMIIGIVAVLAIAGGLYMTVFKKKGPPPPPVKGAVVVLEPITINLEGGHYLRLGLSLQATKKAKETPDGSQAQDLAVSEFSNLSVAELSSNAKRTKLKKELNEKVGKAYEDEIMDTYFTQFVIQ